MDMRFVMMVFVSLFLMTTVSSAAEIRTKSCKVLKTKIENHYANAEEYYAGSLKFRKEKKIELSNLLYADSNIELDAAAKYATIYLALCKHFTAQRNDPLGIR